MDRLQVADTTSLPLNISRGTLTTGTEMYVAEWRHLYLGIRVGLTLQRADEIRRADNRVSFFARSRAAVAVARPAAFAVALSVSN